ncbi:hypothetical protein [Sebaldella sp. S0638]|uniref:hypothetical protein n=1 Tax=Sebaldella sp. S0638 TaxID=2957809 RepID=UPI0020A0F3DD|nr:hypothetical protein [Sebaldella sp. S0638]MCP1223533.1 hypothetical protein [Sebaldella sp. S0638]
MEKCVKDVISYLMVRFPENIRDYYYDEEADIYIVEHNIPDLLEDDEFQEIVYSNLFDNEIYNVLFEYNSD